MENSVTPKGSHLSPLLPSSQMPPLEWAPAGISFRSSEEMSDLFHHRSHKDWTVASLPMSKTPNINLMSGYYEHRKGAGCGLKHSICRQMIFCFWGVFVDKNAI